MSDDKLSIWMESQSDRWNPVLVREFRQAMKGRTFGVSFLLLVILLCLATVVKVSTLGLRLELLQSGRDFFQIYTIILAVCINLIVPLSVFHSTREEFLHSSFEMLAITTLTPYKIVWGKLHGGLLQMLLFYSAMTPYLSFAYLLGGVSVLSFLIFLVHSFLCGLAGSLLGLMLGSLSKQPLWYTINTVQLIGGAAFLIYFTAGFLEVTPLPGDRVIESLVIGLCCWGSFLMIHGFVSVGVTVNRFSPVPSVYLEANFKQSGCWDPRTHLVSEPDSETPPPLPADQTQSDN